MDGPRYQASVLRGPHKVCLLGYSYIIALQPGGARGYLFQSYLCPLSASNADLVGLSCEGRSKFRVFCTCVVSLSHSWRGKVASVVANAEIK